jgi:putative hemolysin
MDTFETLPDSPSRVSGFGPMMRLVIAGWLLAACGLPAQPTVPPPATQPAPGPLETVTPPPAGLPNPASTHCLDQGGRLEIVTLAEGQVGVCVLADGSLCEEWALFRGECKPGQFLPFTVGLEPGLENAGAQLCLERGGQLALLRLSSSAEYGLCVWPSGKLCEQDAVGQGDCGP